MWVTGKVIDPKKKTVRYHFTLSAAQKRINRLSTTKKHAHSVFMGEWYIDGPCSFAKNKKSR